MKEYNKEKNTIDWVKIDERINAKTFKESDESDFQTWFKSSSKHKIWYSNVEKYYQQDCFPYIVDKQIDEAWERWEKRQKNIKYTRTAIFLRWSCSIASILILSIATYVYYNQLSNLDIIKQQSSTHTPIGPSLTLSDGSIINLSELDNKNTEYRDGNTPINIENNQISYNHNIQDNELRYNTLNIPSGTMYHLVLNDGTKVWLNATSTLTYPVTFGTDQRCIKLSGEAFLDVAPDSKRPFVVEVENQKIEVIGTSFNISGYSSDNSIITTLFSGKIHLDLGTGEKVPILPSQQIIVQRQTNTYSIQKVNPSLYDQWRHDRFVFRDNTLKEIMETLGRWYGIAYQFQDPTLENIRFYSSHNRNTNIKTLLQELEQTERVQFEIIDNKVLIKR